MVIRIQLKQGDNHLELKGKSSLRLIVVVI